MSAELLGRRPFRLQNPQPLVSFTFDDFPCSAARTARNVLERHGLRGTYYASFGLMGTTAPTGRIFEAGDLRELLRNGHEIGCHTLDHCHAYDTAPEEFGRSVRRNQEALEALAPGTRMVTLSYPISCPRPGTKRQCGVWFDACRAGGQTFNRGTVDLNHLRSFFIEQSRDDVPTLAAMIRENAAQGGWLIFTTHDVTDSPTRFGCVPALFERLVDLAVGSGAVVLPVAPALAAAGVKARLPRSAAVTA